jgi:Secretion system C-terminal sorting domain
LMATSLYGCTSVSSADIGIITGIEKSLADNLEVYPNPVNTDVVIIKLSIPTNNIDISLFNSHGSRLKILRSIGEHQITLDVSALSEGVYLLKIISDGATVAKKIAIVR